MAYEPKRAGCGQAAHTPAIANLAGELAGPSTESRLMALSEGLERLETLVAELGARISPVLLPVQPSPDKPAMPVDSGHNSPLNDKLRLLEHRIVGIGDDVRLLNSRCCL